VIPVGRNEHDWDLETPRRQLLLHLKTADSWHRKVENHAPDPVQSARPQKLLPRCERLDLEREGPQKQLERVAETLIVVDDGDDARVTLADRSRTGRATSLPDSIARLTAYLRQEAI